MVLQEQCLLPLEGKGLPRSCLLQRAKTAARTCVKQRLPAFPRRPPPQVCLLKMNPVNDYAGPLLEALLAPLVARQLVQLVYGGAEVGKHAARHELVTDVHLTGECRRSKAARQSEIAAVPGRAAARQQHG